MKKITIEVPEKYSDVLAMTLVGSRLSGSINVTVRDKQKQSVKRKEIAMEKLKVGANTKPGAAAGAIAGIIRRARKLEIQAIGAGAVNQSIKAVAIARGYVAAGGLDIICRPAFIDINTGNKDTTAIKIIVEAI